MTSVTLPCGKVLSKNKKFITGAICTFSIINNN